MSSTQAGVYGWTDARGVLDFSDKPPTDGNADRVQLRPTNSFQGEIPAQATPAGPAEPQLPAKAKSVVIEAVIGVGNYEAQYLAQAEVGAILGR